MEQNINLLKSQTDRKRFAELIDNITNTILCQNNRLQEILVNIIKEAPSKPEYQVLLIYLSKGMQEIITLQPFIENFINKFLTKTNSDGLSQNFKYQRQFIGRYIIMTTNNNFLIQVIQKARTSQIYAINYLQCILRAINHDISLGKQIVFHQHSTQFAIFLTNLIKMHNKISHMLLYHVLMLVSIYDKNSSQFHNMLIQNFMPDLNMCLNYDLTFPIALKIVSSYFLSHQQKDTQSLQKSLFTIFSLIQQKHIKPQTILILERQIFMKKDTLSMLPQNYFDQFYEAISYFIKVFCVNKIKFQQKIFSFCYQMLYVDSQPVVASALQYIKMHTKQSHLSQNKAYLNSLKAAIFNCLQFNHFDKQIVQFQQLQIRQCLQWLDKNYEEGFVQIFMNQIVNLKQKSEIIKTNYQSNTEIHANSNNEFDDVLDFMIVTIQKGIQYQFQYQFDERIFRSACNILLYLHKTLQQQLNSQIIKEKVTAIIKSLMNLNQSCTHQNRYTIVHKVLQMIVQYAQYVIIDSNEYLKEVAFQKLVQNLPQSYDLLIKMLNKGFKHNDLQQQLINKLNSADFRSCFPSKYEQTEKIWALILKISKKYPKQWNNMDSWALIRTKVGVQMNRDAWVKIAEQVEKNKQQFRRLGPQFQYDVKICEKFK